MEDIWASTVNQKVFAFCAVLNATWDNFWYYQKCQVASIKNNIILSILWIAQKDFQI